MKGSMRLGAALAALMTASASYAYEANGGIINPAELWNETWNDVLIDLFVIGGAFGLLGAWLLLRYRAKGPNEVGTAKPLGLNSVLAWSLVPVALFMADDFMLAAKGWSLWNIERTVPANAMEIKVNASQWSFEFDYGNGVKTGELYVPVGTPIVLRMTATDVIHSFGLIEYRVKEDIMPGRITHIWFMPDKPRKTFVTCVEFCGDGHSTMNADVNAVPKADFDAWLASKTKKKASLEAPFFASLSPAPAL